MNEQRGDRSFSARNRFLAPVDEQKRQIIALIEAGATDHAAAESAGISARTYRELRQRAEDRHKKRKSTPELREFFDEVDEAIARARIKREIAYLAKMRAVSPALRARRAARAMMSSATSEIAEFELSGKVKTRSGHRTAEGFRT